MPTVVAPTQRCGVEPLLTIEGKPFVYPAAVVECNTFIDVQVGRPLSVDGFYQERRVVSCPTSLISEPEECSSDSLSANCSAMAKQDDESSSCSTAAPAEDAISATSFDQSVALCKRVLRLETTLPVPLLGSPDLPSMGSAGHAKRECKPCAFFNAKGCDSGMNCRFCHLCEPGEKKRRSKEKRQFFGAMRRLQRFASGSV